MRFIILSLFLFLNSLVVCSQTASSSLHGVVADPNGALVPNATVTVTFLGKAALDKNTSSVTKTDEKGNFVFNDLLPGKYKLSVTGIGLETEKQITVPQTKSLEVKLEIKLGRGCDKITDTFGEVSDQDKAEILRQAFTDALILGSGLLMKEQRENLLFVSTKNIKPEWLSDVSDLRLKLMSQRQIQQKADRVGDFLYVSFPYLKVRKQCVAIEVANTWAVGKKSGKGYVSGGGARYEFRKESGKWVKKSLIGWVS